MSKTLKFFTKKWYPWNIIILVLSILLIAILIWGGATNWKFIHKAKKVGADCISRGPCPQGSISTGNVNPPCCKPTPPTPPPPPPPPPTPPPPPPPSSPSSPRARTRKTPRAPPPTRVFSMTLQIDPALSNDKESEQFYAYSKDSLLGSLNPSFITLNNVEDEITAILFGAPKEGVSKSIENYYLLIGFNSGQIINACITSPSWESCTIKIIVDNNFYNFDFKNGIGTNALNIKFKLPNNFPKLSDLVDKQIIVQFIQN